MTKEKENFNPGLKSYHIFLLSCLLCSVLIINSNYVNEKRSKKQLHYQSNKNFDELITLRKLEPQSNSNTDEVCSRGSDDLIEYYRTGDLSLIDLDEDPIECDDKDADYMKALRGLMRNLVGGDDDDDNGGRLRNLDEGDSDKDNIMQYLNRILPMVVFLVIGVLSIFGWIACCIFNCCDCCCCCCCKKKSCKIPWFIFTYVFYALVVAVCIYGLSESNKIFKGLANTECSLLKFLDQILDGEIKQELPRWAGITGINNILSGLSTQINNMGRDTYTELTNKISSTTTKKDSFSTLINNIGNEFFDASDPTRYKADYLSPNFDGYPQILKNPTNQDVKGQYVYYLVKNFGKFENDKFTNGSILYNWNQEYSFIASQADGYMITAQSSFREVLDDNLGPITQELQKAQDTLNDLREPFDDVNSKIGDNVADYADKIDKYGKMAVQIVFSVLMVMNIALAVFMTLIGIFSIKACADCCFCRCIFKSCVHILWNILALMMVLAFLVGSILSLVGRVGEDVMSLASFIFSADNFNSNNPLFLDEMGDDGKRYLRRCILGDGKIAEELNISDQIASFNNVTSIERNISDVLNQFSGIMFSCFVYNTTKNLLKSEADLSNNFYLISTNTDEQHPVFPINFDEALDSLNKKLNDVYDSNKDTWSREGTTQTCPTSGPSGKENLTPLNCNPETVYSSVTYDDIKKYSAIIHESLNLVKKANDKNLNTDGHRSLINVLDYLKDHYIDYLSGYTSVLGFLQTQIGKITSVVRDYTTEGDTFSFLNGQFIKRNLKILLKYLKFSLGKDLYTVGICLVIVGFSLILSISSTILLIVIINLDINQNMNPDNNPPIQGDVMTPGGNMVISEYRVNDPAIQTAPQY